MTIRFKRGDTFDQILVIPEVDFPDGYFLLWDVAAQLRTADKNKLVADLTATWANPAAETRFLQLFAENTTAWPIGSLELDVQFTRQADDYIRSTETIPVQVVKDITLIIPPPP